jgi:hypothetical protein
VCGGIIIIIVIIIIYLFIYDMFHYNVILHALVYF